MHAGATLGRRFTLLRPDHYDLPGVDRWVARDERRAVDVYVDLLTSAAPGAVRQEAVRAAQVRDLRFTRVLATGREPLGGDRVTYVVTETPAAVPLTSFAHQRIVPPQIAGAIVGEAAHALETAAKEDIHHGFLRAEALFVVDSGRVLIAGLGTDGHLATQAGVSEGRSQRADARALARLYLTLVTGRAPEDATVGDLPESLSPRAADMARATLAGTPPAALSAVAHALSPADARELRNISRALGEWEWVPGAEPPPLPPVAVLGLDVELDADTLVRAASRAALAGVGVSATPGLAQMIQAGRVSGLVPAPDKPGAGVPAPGHIPVSAEEAAKFSARTRRAAARQSHQELGLDTWEVIATEQNRTTPPSVVQAVLEWLHRRWPGSVSLGTAAEQARHRARRPAPLNTGPIMVSMFLAVTIVAGIVAFEILTAPAGNQDSLEVEPPSHYPEFTFSPEPLPSPSPEGEGADSADGNDDAESED